MLEPGEYADALRVVGRWLEQHDAHDVEITDEGQYLSASWMGTPGGKRQFRAFELAQLRREARALRVTPRGTPITGMAEMLRTLGGELDRTGIELLSIVEIANGFRLAATASGRRTTTEYSLADIHQMIVAQRAGRGGGGAEPDPSPRPAPAAANLPVVRAPSTAGSPSVPAPSTAGSPAVAAPPGAGATGLRARIQARGNR